MTPALLRAILILPGTALIYVPAVLIWLSHGTAQAASLPGPTRLIAGLIIAVPAVVLMLWTVRLFVRLGGGGTPEPWNPIRNFITTGPYAHVRNPMLIGVCLFLLAEALWLWSLPLLLWAVLFWAGNTVYFAWVEEPGLQRRHGAPYQRYKAAVPRWIPRRTPWRPDPS